jgi:hypothetical protein
MLKFDCRGGCEDRASSVDVDSVRLIKDEVGVSTSSCRCSSGSDRTDSEGCGKMNAGTLVSTLRIARVSESGTRGVSGSALGLPEKEGREKERGTPDNSTVWARMSFCG